MEILKWSQKAGRIASVEPGLIDVLCHDGASSNHNTITNRHRKNSRVSTDANAVTDSRGLPLIPMATRRAAFVKQIVDEHRPVRDEAIVSHRNKLTDKRVRLDSASLTDAHSFLNLNEWSYKGLVTNGTSVKVNRLYDDDVVPKLDTNYTGYTEVGFTHSSLRLFAEAVLPYTDDPIDSAECRKRALYDSAPLTANDRTRRPAAGEDKYVPC